METQKAVEDQNIDLQNEVSVEEKKQPEPAATTTEDDKPAGAEISDREESSISVQDKDIPNDAAKGGTDTEEAGYKSDQSASEEGSTDNVVDRQRSKGSSGYEESDDYEEGEGSDVSEGQRMGNEDEAKEYDEGVSDNESSDVVIEESQSENGTEGYEEDREDESRDDEEFKEELDKEDPQSVPRKTGFWDHDDRFEEISIEESRPPKGDRQLWDITSERWQHDKYVEAEQGPRSLREIEESEKQFDRRNRRRNERQLGDFMRGGRGRRGGGRGGGGRGGGGRGGGGGGGYRNERGPENEDEYRQNDRRGPSSHLRGSPRGRGDFRRRRTERTPKESEYNEWGADEEDIDNTNETVEHSDDLQTERIDEKRGKNSKKHANTDTRSNVHNEIETNKNKAREEKRQMEHGHTKSPESKQSAQKQDSTKVKHEHDISRSKEQDEKRHANQSNVKSQESRQSAKKQESAEEHRGPRGRGKGMTSKKITSAKKSAVDFRKERKKSDEHGDEEIYEDAEENITEEPDAAQQKHAVKPKRYSTQRQKQATANEGAPNQPEESNIHDQQYFDANLQGNYQPQNIAFNPNMMILLQQLQQMQLQQQQQQQMQQQQSVQQQQPVQQQQQSMPSQVPGGQNQGPAVLTPLMQQYMQQQLMNMQALQQAYAQQQQQMQQQMQGIRMGQQPTMPSGEPQGQAPEGGMMMPRNAFPNVSQNMPHYNIIQQNQPGIYPQTGGTQYVEQMMSAPQPPSQQSGLYIPQVQQVSQQQGPDENIEQYAQRKARPAAIPIKPPPEVQ